MLNEKFTYSFSTSFTSLMLELKDYLNSNDISYTLNHEGCWHIFKMDMTEPEADLANNFIDNHSISSI